MAETVNITICGDGGCGKSSITLRLVRSQWTHEYDPTIEDSYSVTRTVDGLPYLLALTDTAGQEEYRGLWAAQNLKSDAFLLVYDITNAASLETLDYFLDMIDAEADERVDQNARLLKDAQNANNPCEQLPVGMAPPVKLIAANKCDLKDTRVVSARQGLEFARRRGCGFMETSAREMVNIEETFALIVRRVVEARRVHRLQQFTPQPQLQEGNVTALPSTQSLFNPDLTGTYIHNDSHSRTPALTPLERKLSDANYSDLAEKQKRKSQWLGLGRAISKRIGKRPKGEKSPDQANSVAGPEKAERLSSNLRSERHSRSTTTDKQQQQYNSYDEGSSQQTEDNAQLRHQFWWRRVSCF